MTIFISELNLIHAINIFSGLSVNYYYAHATNTKHNQGTIKKWLTEVCTDVEKEPQSQPLTGETILPRSDNKQEEARLDLRSKGFCNRQQNTFFDVRVFHPNALSYRHTEMPALYRQQENEKKREYLERIREMDYALFTPHVFSTTGGQGKEITI